MSHAVVLIDPSAPEQRRSARAAECRDAYGQRCSDQDLELEIYRSGDEINLMLSWWDNRNARCSAWAPSGLAMAIGQRGAAPQDAAPLEALGRRLRALVQPASQRSS